MFALLLVAAEVTDVDDFFLLLFFCRIGVINEYLMGNENFLFSNVKMGSNEREEREEKDEGKRKLKPSSSYHDKYAYYVLMFRDCSLLLLS